MSLCDHSLSEIAESFNVHTRDHTTHIEFIFTHTNKDSGVHINPKAPFTHFTSLLSHTLIGPGRSSVLDMRETKT
jgi:hypothetical protein